MTSRHEATRGLLLVLVAIVALAFAVSNARHHFASITADVRFPPLKNGKNVRLISERIALVPHAFDHVPIDGTRHAIGALDSAGYGAGRLHVQGWIVTPNRDLGTHVVAIVDDAIRIEITSGYNQERPDVVGALGSTNVLRSGIDTTFILPKLTRGGHRITFAVASKDGSTLLTLNAERSFRIP